MSWINKHKNLGRLVVLALLLVAILGPWGYTLDGVPPGDWCYEPFFLLENGRCAGLVRGIEMLAFMAYAFLSMSVGLVTGATVLPGRARELFGVFLVTISLFLLVLPFITTLLLAWGKDSRRLRVSHLAAWGLAAALVLLLEAFQPELRSGRFWGLWLYTGLAAGALVMEVLASMSGKIKSSVT